MIGSLGSVEKVLKVTAIVGVGVSEEPIKRTELEGKAPGHIFVLVIDEYAIHIILPGEKSDDLLNQVRIVSGKIDQIGPAVGGDDDLRIRLIRNPARAADQSIAANRVLAHVRELLSDWPDRLVQTSSRHLGHRSGYRDRRAEGPIHERDQWKQNPPAEIRC